MDKSRQKAFFVFINFIIKQYSDTYGSHLHCAVVVVTLESFLLYFKLLIGQCDLKLRDYNATSWFGVPLNVRLDADKAILKIHQGFFPTQRLKNAFLKVPIHMWTRPFKRMPDGP